MMTLRWCSRSAEWPTNHRLPAVEGSHRLLAGGRSLQENRLAGMINRQLGPDAMQKK